MTEHWKTEDQLSLNTLHGFNMSSAFCRTTTSHGGSAIYIKHNYKYITGTDINSLSIEGCIDGCRCEVQLNGKRLVIVCVYRPPSGDFSKFMETLEAMIHRCSNEGKNIVLAGDGTDGIHYDLYLYLYGCMKAYHYCSGI